MDSCTVKELAAIAGVSTKTVYNWIQKAPETMRTRLGDMSNGAKFDMEEASQLLRIGGRDFLSDYLNEAEFFKSAYRDEHPLEKPSIRLDVVYLASAKAGRRKEEDVPAWISLREILDGGENEKRIMAELYNNNVRMTIIDGARYVALNSLPPKILRSYIARLIPEELDIEAFRHLRLSSDGEIWISGDDISHALGWSRALVSARGWRTPWKGRPILGKKGKGFEYELSSLPKILQDPILRFLCQRESKAS